MSALPEGPWTIEPGANSHLFDARIMAGGACIAFAEGEVRYDEEGDAVGIAPSPATFAMAAAYELLEAAVQARAVLLTARSEYDLGSTQHGVIERRLEILNAAIAKARGGAA